MPVAATDKLLSERSAIDGIRSRVKGGEVVGQFGSYWYQLSVM